jgi:hypothetical protein
MCLFLLRDTFIYILLNASCMGPMGWGCGKTLGGNREIFLDLLDMRWEIGLMYDVWCGDQTLKEAFLVLYRIDSFKKASVAGHMVVANICQWNITFTRPVHDLELEMVTLFLQPLVLYHVEQRRWAYIFQLPSTDIQGQSVLSCAKPPCCFSFPSKSI